MTGEARQLQKGELHRDMSKQDLERRLRAAKQGESQTPESGQLAERELAIRDHIERYKTMGPGKILEDLLLCKTDGEDIELEMQALIRMYDEEHKFLVNRFQY